MPPALDWLETAAEAAKRGTRSFEFIQTYDIHGPYAKPLGFARLMCPDYHGVGEEIVAQAVTVQFIHDGRFYQQAYHRWLADRSVQVSRDALRGQPSVALTTRDIAFIRSAYDGAISYADVYVGLLRKRLRELGLESKSLIVVMGDHGEWLLENGRLGHSLGLQDGMTHVPLILWGPGGLPQGRRIHSVVELIDIFPTVLDAWDLKPQLSLPGTSLLPLARGSRPDAEGSGCAISVEPGRSETSYSVRSATHRYTKQWRADEPRPIETLADVRTDRLQGTLVPADGPLEPVCAALRAAGEARLKKGWQLE